MNDCTLPSSGIVLHVWPGQWDLPSFDPQCLAALLYLQLAIPGQFRVAECSYPDLSPTGRSFRFFYYYLKTNHGQLGQLPFLTHEQHVVAPCTSIIKYISGLSNSEHAVYPNANLDAHLTPSEISKRTAWFSHASSHLSDLVVRRHFSSQILF
jgi:sorting and assembly machinery component 37